MAPITMVFIITGLAVFTQAMFFLGIGASAEEGKKSPIIPVGYISVIAGIVNLVVGLYITVVRPIDDDPSLLLAGLIGFYGLFFLALGLAEILSLDLRVVGNLAIPTAIVPLFWINFFAGSTTFTLMLTAIFTFFLVPVFLVMGWNLP